jgi:hypothetical protein
MSNKIKLASLSEPRPQKEIKPIGYDYPSYVGDSGPNGSDLKPKPITVTTNDGRILTLKEIQQMKKEWKAD